jgi:hypothetical protein
MVSSPELRKVIMPLFVNRWRVVVLHRDGSVGPTFFCVTPAQRSLFCLALSATGCSFVVEEYSV